MPRSPEPGRPPARVPVHVEAVRVPGGQLRWFARLDPADARAYEAAVARVHGPVEGALGPGVLAERSVSRHGRIVPAPWRAARRSWAIEIERALGGSPPPVVLAGDVHECYATIAPQTVAGRLRALGARAAEIESVERMLERFVEEGVRGLPVGPAASAVLANAVMAEVDEVLTVTGMRHLRWVDDVVVFADDARAATRAHDAFRRALDGLGLAAHPDKTAVVADPDASRARLSARRLSFSRLSSPNMR